MRTDEVPFLHVCRRTLGVPRVHTHTGTHAWVPRAELPTPPGPGGGAAVELKRKKSLLVGQNTSNPNIPTPPNRIKAKDRHLNKPRRRVKQ